MAQRTVTDLKPALIVWNDAYQDASYDGPLEEISPDTHLQQTTVGFIIKNDRRVIKFCSEICPQTGHVRNIVAVPRRYVVSVTPLCAIIDTSSTPDSKEKPNANG